MSLDAVMRTALSGMNANQAALRSTSNNIANVNTPGYAREEVLLETRALDGRGAGVDIAEVRRIVDDFLNRELITISAKHGYYDSQALLHDRLQSLLGNPESLSTLTNLIDESFSSIGTLATEPSQLPRRISALSDLQNLGDAINRLAEQLQLLRADADARIQSDINVVNSALEEVHELNQVIVQQRLSGHTPSALEEQRARAIEKVSSAIDIRSVQLSDYSVTISTVSGVTLVDSSLRQLVYTPPSLVETSVSFTDISANKVDPVTGVVASTGDSLATSLRNGTIKGLIDMRDKELPEAAVALGELAANIVDQINGVHNNSSAVPAPNALTGRNTGAIVTDPHGFTGQTTFAVLDANNEISSSYTIDFSGVGLVTLQDVINDVNANIVGGTLALTNGVMSFTATAGTDSVATLQLPADPSSRGGRGFAHFFGLNDLMDGRYLNQPETGMTGTAAHGFGATGTVNIEFRGPGGDLAASHTLDFTTLGGTINAVITDLNTNFAGYGTFALDSNGKLTMTPASGYESYDMAVRSDSTNRGTTGVSFSQFFGVGNRYNMDAAFGVGVKSAIDANPSLMALAQLDTGAGAGTPALTSGDNRGANALFALTNTQVSFSAAGDLPALSSTLADYAGHFLSNLGIEADRVSTLAEDRKFLVDEISTRRDTVSGVNLDEELSNMIIFQNAFNAAARLITTTNQMFDTLLSIA